MPSEESSGVISLCLVPLCCSASPQAQSSGSNPTRLGATEILMQNKLLPLSSSSQVSDPSDKTLLCTHIPSAASLASTPADQLSKGKDLFWLEGLVALPRIRLTSWLWGCGKVACHGRNIWYPRSLHESRNKEYEGVAEIPLPSNSIQLDLTS